MSQVQAVASCICFTLVAIIALIVVLVRRNAVRYDERISIECPPGTFVKKIEWGHESIWAMGIIIECSEPEFGMDSNYFTTLMMNPEINFRSLKERTCTAVRGITVVMENSQNIAVDLDITSQCTPGPSAGDKLFCEINSAMVGLDATILSRGYLTNINIRCTDVGDIATTCLAHDYKQRLLSCDATNAIAGFNCTLQRTVGAGYVSAMSDVQTNEFQFYIQFGFDINLSLYKLHINFKSTVGLSTTTKYDWESFEDATWKESSNLTVEIEAIPGCETVINEVVGTCSFMYVRPIFLERVDTCKDFCIRTKEIIVPSANGIYRSKSPLTVANRPGEYDIFIDNCSDSGSTFLFTDKRQIFLLICINVVVVSILLKKNV